MCPTSNFWKTPILYTVQYCNVNAIKPWVVPWAETPSTRAQVACAVLQDLGVPYWTTPSRIPMEDTPIYGRLQALFQDTLRLISPLHQEPSTKSHGLLQGFTAVVKYESTHISVKKRDCLEEVAFMRKKDPGARIGLVSAGGQVDGTHGMLGSHITSSHAYSMLHSRMGCHMFTRTWVRGALCPVCGMT